MNCFFFSKKIVLIKTQTKATSLKIVYHYIKSDLEKFFQDWGSLKVWFNLIGIINNTWHQIIQQLQRSYFRPFLVAISCFHPLSGGDAQARNTAEVTPGILVKSGYGLSTGAKNWKCIGLDSEQLDDDWAQVKINLILVKILNWNVDQQVANCFMLIHSFHSFQTGTKLMNGSNLNHQFKCFLNIWLLICISNLTLQ